MNIINLKNIKKLAAVFARCKNGILVAEELTIFKDCLVCIYIKGERLAYCSCRISKCDILSPEPVTGNFCSIGCEGGKLSPAGMIIKSNNSFIYTFTNETYIGVVSR